VREAIRRVLEQTALQTGKRLLELGMKSWKIEETYALKNKANRLARFLLLQCIIVKKELIKRNLFFFLSSLLLAVEMAEINFSFPSILRADNKFSFFFFPQFFGGISVVVVVVVVRFGESRAQMCRRNANASTARSGPRFFLGDEWRISDRLARLLLWSQKIPYQIASAIRIYNNNSSSNKDDDGGI
jgi:hypothetical protein